MINGRNRHVWRTPKPCAASIKSIITVLALGLANVGQAGPNVPATWLIQGGEGGRDSVEHHTALTQWFAEQGCPLQVEVSDSAESMTTRSARAQWVFRVSSLVPGDARFVARTRGNQPLTVTWLVPASLGMTDLSGLSGERLALLNQNSLLGWEAPLALLKQAKVKINPAKLYHTHAFEGAVALLLHQDVFAATVPKPLAHAWAAANDLSILAESSPYWAGITSNAAVTADCETAFVSFHKEGRNDERFKLFPEWLTGFAPVKLP
ncbi:MAG: PhnD/SsuA/transferrin family substrate-binding protein [Hahellaceae bacterium]|nr:PhnD/SsuA/transferrin family substrate-binding protein [Hahellaceae bacterium]MCP5169703.1 PhnD/SsuA/transferrin family substrate-binding protein [Hahellaceae bacterium]